MNINTQLLALIFLAQLILLWRMWRLDKNLAKKGNTLSLLGFTDHDDASEDELYKEAVALLPGLKHISTSYLQRRLKIGYARSARLIDQLEERELISSRSRSGFRRVIPPREEKEY